MKVLLLDTAFAAAPIYDGLIRAGHDVWVMGNRPADLLAAKAGGNWIEQDYSHVAAVTAHIRRLGIGRVVPGCTDLSMDTSLQLGVAPDLMDSPETNAVLANKEAFRGLCRRLELPAPQMQRRDTFPRAGRYICKPVNAFSGRGITIFDGQDGAALDAAVAFATAASPTGEWLIETFAPGELYSCSGFVEGGKFQQVFYVREGSSANPFAVDTSYVVRDMPKACTEKLEASLEKICAALALKDGLLHTQFLMDGETPHIVEVSRRCPGDLYSMLIEYSTGFKYAAKYASYYAGTPLNTKCDSENFILRHTVTSTQTSVYGGLAFDTAASVLAFYPLQIVGQSLLENQKSRAGILFTQSQTYDALVSEHHRFLNRSAYKVAW